MAIDKTFEDKQTIIDLNQQIAELKREKEQLKQTLHDTLKRESELRIEFASSQISKDMLIK